MLVSSRNTCLLAQRLDTKQQIYGLKQFSPFGRSIPDHIQKLSLALSEDGWSVSVDLLTVIMLCICNCGQNDSSQ